MTIGAVECQLWTATSNSILLAKSSGSLIHRKAPAFLPEPSVEAFLAEPINRGYGLGVALLFAF